MKYVDEYRDGALARSLAAEIAREARPGRTYRLMEFCGGHTHAISRYGLEDLLPPNVRLIHGSREPSIIASSIAPRDAGCVPLSTVTAAAIRGDRRQG